MSLYQVGTLTTFGPGGRPLGSRSAAQHWLRQSCFSGSTPLKPDGRRALVLGLARASPARPCGKEPSARPLGFSLRSRASARRCSAALVGLRPRLGCCARPWRASLSPARSGVPGPLAGLKSASLYRAAPGAARVGLRPAPRLVGRRLRGVLAAVPASAALLCRSLGPAGPRRLPPPFSVVGGPCVVGARRARLGLGGPGVARSGASPRGARPPLGFARPPPCAS